MRSSAPRAKEGGSRRACRHDHHPQLRHGDGSRLVTSGTRGITEATGEILAILARHRAPATFFYVGREAEAHPQAVRDIVAAGHEIGCHTMFHETVGKPVYDVPVGGF